jgi:hypothetical protein
MTVCLMIVLLDDCMVDCLIQFKFLWVDSAKFFEVRGFDDCTVDCLNGTA